MTEPQAKYIPCKSYLPWTKAPGPKLNWQGCYYLSVDPDPKVARCEYMEAGNELAGEICPHAKEWL